MTIDLLQRAADYIVGATGEPITHVVLNHELRRAFIRLVHDDITVDGRILRWRALSFTAHRGLSSECFIVATATHLFGVWLDEAVPLGEPQVQPLRDFFYIDSCLVRT